MDEFTLKMDVLKFRQTNASWNELCLNDPWSVGYVSTLIETQIFPAKEQWEAFYYNSGQERELKVQLLSYGEQQLLNNHLLKRTNARQIEQLEWSLKNINFQFGRTREQLYTKGQILHDYITQRGINLTVDECAECVRYRTICETWNGIIMRERNTVQKLKESLPAIEFIKTSGDFDHKYAVDYELCENGKLFCGIQIKPRSYTSEAPYIVKARNANIRKNQDYFNSFQRPVFNVISKTNGDIENTDVIEKITKIKR